MTAAGIDAGGKTLTNVAPGAVSATSTDAINGGQLYAVQQTASAGWGLSVNGAAPIKVAPGATVGLSNTDGNIALTQTGTSVVANLNPDLKASSLTTGGTVMNGSGVTIAGGPSMTTAGIDAGSKTISNVAAGVAAMDAVNKSQLDAVASVAGAGWTAAGNEGAAVAVKPAATLEIVFDPATNTVAIQMSDAPNFGGPVTAGGLSIRSNSVIDMGGNRVTNAAAGVADGDLATVGQMPVRYVLPDGATRSPTPTNDVAFSGVGGGPVVLHNVAAGVAPLDAANIAQLTAVKLQLPGQWSAPTSNTYVFGNAAAGGGPATLTNVAPGRIEQGSTDAVNGGQIYGLAQGVNNLAAYTQQGFAKLQGQIDRNDKLSRAGVAHAAALAAMRYDDRPGKFSTGAGVGYHRGQMGVALGAGYTTEDRKWRFNAGAAFSPTNRKADVTINAGATYTWN